MLLHQFVQRLFLLDVGQLLVLSQHGVVVVNGEGLRLDSLPHHFHGLGTLFVNGIDGLVSPTRLILPICNETTASIGFIAYEI